MKNLIIASILAVLTAFMTSVRARDWQQEYLGLPGDNLNLYAVMKMFQESETLEGFERSLNDKNSMINNLDLNNDNLVDYITVTDYPDGNVHNIVLRTALGRNEYQDVAVFTVEKFRNGSVSIQLIGDEELYGKNYIIEPSYAETPNPGYTGKTGGASRVTVVTAYYHEPAIWPVVRFIYLPDYVIWRSSWYWGYYPVYWNPWRPHYWHYYYGYHNKWHQHYYQYYHHSDHHHYARYNDFYYRSIRKSSPIVVVNINMGHYKTTYSRPEQRREGEAYYNRVQARKSNETRTSTAVKNRSVNSSSSDQTRVRTAEKSGAGRERTSTPAVRTRTETNTPVTRNTENNRRVASTPAVRTNTGSGSGKERVSSTTVRTRNQSNTQMAQRSETKSRVAPAETARTASKPAAAQNNAVRKTAAPEVNERIANRPSEIRKAEPARKPASNTAPAGNSSVRTRSTGANNSSTMPARRTGNSRETENNRKTSR